MSNEGLLRKLSKQQREFLEEATSTYEQAFDGVADEYLRRTRGDMVADYRSYYRLGYVAEPLDGHEKFQGRLAIPYLTPAGVVDLRFRCILAHDCKERQCAKYLSLPGTPSPLFNVRSLHIDSHGIALTEGEMDALAMEQNCHLPAVGYPGVSTWKKNRYWRRCFDGYTLVYIIADGDEPGREAAQTVLRDLPNGRIISMPDGHDATSFIMEYGREAMLEKLGIKEGSE